ncbi:hypothetical protein HWV62_12122 [Athelia sp. TMB]|nr:hypothetical protein HWV62_12122 [Athelia sp. TMB]
MPPRAGTGKDIGLDQLITSLKLRNFRNASPPLEDLIAKRSDSANTDCIVSLNIVRIPSLQIRELVEIINAYFKCLIGDTHDDDERARLEMEKAENVGSDSSGESTPRVAVVSSFGTLSPTPFLPLDARTKKPLATFPSVKHLYPLLHTAFGLLLPRVGGRMAGPSRTHIDCACDVHERGAVEGDMERVCGGSPLGKEENQAVVMYTVYADASPPPIFLSELYAQSLLTLGDHEFFTSASSSYEDGVPGITLKWEGMQEKLTHSRRHSTSPGHWHITSSQIGMSSFIEAAMIEEQLAQPTDLLNNISFLIIFELRVFIFRNLLATDMMVRVDRHGRGRAQECMFRWAEVSSRMDQLDGVNLKEPVEITFIGQFGQDEYVVAFLQTFHPLTQTLINRASLDGGGVSKEFFTSLRKEVFDTNPGLWLANKKNGLYPNPHSYATECAQSELVAFHWPYSRDGQIQGQFLLARPSRNSSSPSDSKSKVP